MKKTTEWARTTEHVLGGFISDAILIEYQKAFRHEFPELSVARYSDRLIRYWHSDQEKTVSKAEQRRVEMWHHGFRACLKCIMPNDY